MDIGTTTVTPMDGPVRPPPPPPPLQDELVQWERFLRSYSQGGFRADQAPWSPPLPLPKQTPSGQSDNAAEEYAFNVEEFQTAPLYERVEIDLETARRVRNFYARYGFLPPPRGSREPERERCVEEYDLYSADQVRRLVYRTGVSFRLVIRCWLIVTCYVH
jgi:hypothetical protein